MSTNKTIITIITGLTVIGLIITVTTSSNTENLAEESETVKLSLECPENFSENDVITLKVLDDSTGLENVSVYIEGDRFGKTNRHGNIVIQAPDSSFETEFRYDNEFLEAENSGC